MKPAKGVGGQTHSDDQCDEEDSIVEALHRLLRE